MANYIAKGRQVIVPLTNKSGSAVEYGDVVICDTGTAASFDVTTTAGYSDSFIGVVADNAGIAIDAVGRICLSGYVAQINLDGAASIGDFLFTDTVAEQGTPSATRAEGAFGQALTASATPAAIVWGIPDPAQAAGSVAADAIWDAAGDLVQGTGANTAARLAIGTVNQLLRVNAAANAVEWVSAGRVLINEATPTGTTVTWNSISNIYSSLEIEFVARTDKASVTNDSAELWFNNDTTAANYFRTSATANDTAVGAGDASSSTVIYATAATAGAGDAASGTIKIPFYKSTTFNKMAIVFQFRREDADTHFANWQSLTWESTAAISRIDIVTTGGDDFIAGTTFRLYGVF